MFLIKLVLILFFTIIDVLLLTLNFQLFIIVISEYLYCSV